MNKFILKSVFVVGIALSLHSVSYADSNTVNKDELLSIIMSSMSEDQFNAITNQLNDMTPQEKALYKLAL